MTAGDLTLEGLQTFKMGCKSCFRAKDIPEEEQVGRVAWSFQDPQMQEWYIVNQEQIDAMEFPDYMNELRKVWLPSDWEQTAQAKVLSTLQGDRVFWEWVMEIQNLKAHLRGTASHLSERMIHHQLEANHNPKLVEACHHELIDDMIDLHQWLENVHCIDDRCRQEVAAQRQLVEEMFRE